MKSLKSVILLLLGLTCSCFASVLSGNAPDPTHADLMFWLKADTLTGLSNGDTVSTWADSSVNGINFTGGAYAAMPTSAMMPTYVASGLNGLPALSFDGGDWLGSSQLGSVEVVGPVTMIVVASNIGLPSGSHGTFVSFNRSDNGYHQSTLYSYGPETLRTSSRTGKTGDGSNTNSDTSYTAGSDIIGMGMFDNGVDPDFGVHVPSVNGVIGDLPAAARSSSYDRISIGAMTRQIVPDNAHSYLIGEISEVLVYNKVLSPLEFNEVGNYLSSKYGISTEFTPVIGDIIETDGDTLVKEENATSDTFDVSLRYAPPAGMTVTVTVMPESSDIELTGSAGPGMPIDLTFTSANWGSDQTVEVSAIDDIDPESVEIDTINLFVVSDPNTDPNFNGAFIPSVEVTIIDNDSAGVVLNIDDGIEVNEQGPTQDTYTVALVGEPTSDVTIDLSDDADPGQVQISPASLVFTVSNYNTPQTVVVTAIDDAVLEFEHSTTISHVVSSLDLAYDEFTADSVAVTILDNECGVWGYASMDVNKDCYVNLDDFAQLASEWLLCTNPQDAACVEL